MLQQSTALTGCNKLIHVIACCKNDEMSFKKIVKALKNKEKQYEDRKGSSTNGTNSKLLVNI